MIVIELTAAVDSSGTLRTFYLSTDSFTTLPTDTPANISFDPRIVDPGNISIHAYADASTTGQAAQLQAGEITLANADGALDGWLNYSFDGRPLVIREGDASDPYPGGFTELFVGVTDSLDATWTNMVIAIKDKQFLFDNPVLTNTYLGNNVLPNGVEGTTADLFGQPKPQVFGTVYQVSPKFINTSLLTYQVNDGSVVSIAAVYDRGTLLTAGTNFTTAALLQASVPTAGTYNTCLAAGMFQLGSSPAGTVTADVVQNAASTAAQTLRSLALAAGLSVGEISASDVATLDILNNAQVGIWIDGSTTFKDAMDQIAASVGAWYGFISGVLRMGILTEPSGTPKLTLHDYEFGEGIVRRAARDKNIPVWKVTLNHTKIWTTQTDVAGSVPAATRAYLGLQYRSVIQFDAAVKLQYKQATELVVNTLLSNLTAATNEASRQLSLQKKHRDFFDVPIDISLLPATPLIYMDPIELIVSRFGLDSGKLFRLTGITYNLAASQVILTLWG